MKLKDLIKTLEPKQKVIVWRNGRLLTIDKWNGKTVTSVKVLSNGILEIEAK